MLNLEKYTENDYQLYSRLVFNEQVMNMNLGRIFTDEEASSFFEMMLSCNAESPDLGFYKLFSEQNGDGEYIGMGALNRNDDYGAIEIEYMLLPEYWNQGHGTALVKMLLQKANRAHSDADIVAITDPANTYSKRILQRAGFDLVKKYVNDDGEPAELYIKRAGSAGE